MIRDTVNMTDETRDWYGYSPSAVQSTIRTFLLEIWYRYVDQMSSWVSRLNLSGMRDYLCEGEEKSLSVLIVPINYCTWSVNVLVARVVISFILLGFLFYISIVVTGTSSYEFPFQTPASTALRSYFPRLTLPNVTQLIYATRKNIQKFLRRAASILLLLTGQPRISLNGPVLRLPVWDLEALRRQSLDDVGCVC